jgi:hypothetical protein
MSQQKFRERKNTLVKELKRKVKELTDTNAELQEEVTILRAQLVKTSAIGSCYVF